MVIGCWLIGVFWKKKIASIGNTNDQPIMGANVSDYPILLCILD